MLLHDPFGSLWNYVRAYIAVAFQQSQHNGLALVLALNVRAEFAVLVLRASLPINAHRPYKKFTREGAVDQVYYYRILR
jgi:hypothetical protein